MTRTAAVFLSVIWISILITFDLALLLRSDGLKEQVDRALKEAFVSRVTYESFEGGWPSDLVLKGVRIYDPESATKLLVALDRVRLDMDWSRLLLKRSPLAGVYLHRPQLKLQWDARGSIYLPSPLRESESSGEKPRVHIEGLALELVNSPYLFRPNTFLELPKFEVVIVPSSTNPKESGFEARIDDPKIGDLQAQGSFFPGGFSLKMTRKSHELTPWLKESLVPEIADALSQFELGGRMEFQGELANGKEAEDSATFAGRVNLNGASIRLAGANLPLSNLMGSIRYEGGVLSTTDLRGEWGDGVVAASATVDFSRSPVQVEAHGSIIGLELSDGFVADLHAFPNPLDEAARQLMDWRLRGPVDLRFTVGSAPGISGLTSAAKPSLKVSLRNNMLVYQGFPYPIRNLSGEVELDEVGLEFKRLTAASNGLSLEARGHVNYEFAGRESWRAIVRARNLVIDEELMSALGEDVSSTVQDLNLEGRVDLQLVSAHRAGDVEKPPSVSIDLKGLSMRPKMFPIRFEEVNGRVHLDENERLRAEGLSARRGEATVVINGHMDLGEKNGPFLLDAILEHVVPDEELVHALEVVDPEIAATYRSLHASGTLKLADVRLRGTLGMGSPELEASLVFKDWALEPDQLPLHVTDFTGQVDVIVKPGLEEVTVLEGSTGKIANVPFSIAGRFVPSRGYVLRARATDFPVDDSLMDELGIIVPELKDRNVRPRIAGRGLDAQVTVIDEGAGPRVQARVDLGDLSIAPPAWSGIALERVRARATLIDGLFRVESLVGEIPRPKNLPPLPPSELTGGSKAFQTDPAIAVEVGGCDFRPTQDRIELGLSRIRLVNVPLESWVLGILGVPEADRARFVPAGLGGIADFSMDSASIGKARTIVNGASVDIRSLLLGSRGELYVEKSELRNLDLTAFADGTMTLGGPRTSLVARNMRLLSMPIPRIEANVSGDHQVLLLEDLSAVLLGYEDDRFVLETATLPMLRQRTERQGYLTREEAALMGEAQLRELLIWKERFDVDGARLEQLRAHASELGIMNASRLKRLDAKELREVIRTHSRALGQPLGVLSGERTHFGIRFDTGRFWFDGHLEGLRIADLIRTLGGAPGDLRGRLKAWLTLDGQLSDLQSYTGTGSVQASLVNAIELPLFLGVMKALDFSSWFQNSRRADVVVHFVVRDRALRLTEGKLTSSDLDLVLIPPGTITLGGIIHAAFDVRHKGGIPLVSDIIDILPSLLLSGVTVQGPLENPTVTVRSLGGGADPTGTSEGRKPRLKDPGGG